MSKKVDKYKKPNIFVYGLFRLIFKVLKIVFCK